MTDNYFVFTIDGKYYACLLSAVDKVIRAMALIYVPNAPETLLGLINIKGKIIPVADIRKLFRLPAREIELDDRIIIANLSGERIAFIADSVEGIVDESFKMDYQNQGAGSNRSLEASGRTEPSVAGSFSEIENYIEGVGNWNNNIVIIYNIDKLFSNTERV